MLDEIRGYIYQFERNKEITAKIAKLLPLSLGLQLKEDCDEILAKIMEKQFKSYTNDFITRLYQNIGQTGYEDLIWT